MKRKEIEDHLTLVSEWNEYLNELSEKHGDKKKKVKKHPKIQPKVINPEMVGLRVQDSEKNEFTIEDVDDKVVTLVDPEGQEEKLTKSSLSHMELS